MSTDEQLDAEAEAARERERELGADADAAAAGLGTAFVRALTGAALVTTLAAVVLALAVGALIIALSDAATREAIGYFTARPSDTFGAAWDAVSGAYGALLAGSLGGVSRISETLVFATPLILTGLAVAVPFRAGLFNIGGEGQVIFGGAAAGLAGFALAGLPLVVHLPVAVLAGVLGGALYGFVPGILKARTGAHEVITTIMLNNIAGFLLVEALLSPLFSQPGRNDPISRGVADSAVLPLLLSSSNRVNAGLLLALVAAGVVWWLVDRSTLGFQIRAVGANQTAARTAGMSVERMTTTTMTIAGALAGLAGAAIILGVQNNVTPAFAAGAGFDGITVALLGRGKPLGTVGAGLLFGGLSAGGLQMQAATAIPIDLIDVISGLIILFIAAPALVQAIFRIRAQGVGTSVATGWSA